MPSNLKRQLRSWVEKTGYDMPPPANQNNNNPALENAIYEDDRFIIFLNPPGREHGPAHVHIRMKNATHRETPIREARLLLLKGQPGPNGETTGYCETYPYYGRQARRGSRAGFYNIPNEPPPGAPEGWWPAATPKKKKFMLSGKDMEEAMECVNQKIGLCIEKWEELYQDTPQAHEFITHEELDGINFGRHDPLVNRVPPPKRGRRSV